MADDSTWIAPSNPQAVDVHKNLLRIDFLAGCRPFSGNATFSHLKIFTIDENNHLPTGGSCRY